MEEYYNYIKWEVKSQYIDELNKLGCMDSCCIFYDDIDYKMIKSDIICIIDSNSIIDSALKIHKYKNILEKQFEIMDISVFKISDIDKYTVKYIISFYCVNFKKYNEDKRKYDLVFSEKIEKNNEIISNTEKIIEGLKKYSIELNNLDIGEKTQLINDVFIKLLYSELESVEQKVRILDKRKVDLNNTIEESKYTFEKIERNIENDIQISYIDKIITILKSKKIKLSIQNNNKNYKKIKSIYDYMYCKDWNAYAIVDLNDNNKNMECANILLNLKVNPIIISKDNRLYKNKFLFMASVNRILEFFPEQYMLYITDKDYIEKRKNIVNIKINCNEITIENIINEILNTDNSELAFSNLDDKNSIKVFTGTFFDYDGSNYYSGGAERYLIDLHDVCKSMGIKLRIYQKSSYDFLRLYNDLEIIGLSSNKQKYKSEYDQDLVILNRYKANAKGKTLLNIFSAFMECYGKNIKPSVGISHGIAWDYDKNVYVNKNLNDKAWIVDSAIACDKVISVDTNTSNYFQTIDFKLGNSMEVIPNYVDLKEFSPKIIKKYNQNMIILYPRRLTAARGLYVLLDIVDKIFENFENVEIHFVGKGNQQEIDKIQEKILKWGDNKIKLYNCPPEKMYSVYQNADISVIPTLYSEGTSLSCLEAMASKNAVIATRVGGLSDLIINNYNGKLIEPNSESLYEAIKDFITNKSLMRKCRKNAREVAKSFNKNIWKSRWEDIIRETMIGSVNGENIAYKVIKIFVSDENIKSKKLKSFIIKKLANNNVIYIVNNSHKNTESCGRIQYIGPDEILYTPIDQIIIDKNYKEKQNINGLEEDFQD